MSRGDFHVDSDDIIRTVYRLADGEVIEVDGFRELNIDLPDDGSRSVRTAGHQELSDGTLYTPVMAQRRRPVDLGVCAHCRRPPWQFPFRERPSLGLVRLDVAARCVECGRLLCPNHQFRGRDRRIRCLVHDRQRSLTEALDWVFFRKHYR